MRNVFLALVLANLAFAAWDGWFARPAAGSRAADRGAPGLTLVSELPPASKPDAEPGGGAGSAASSVSADAQNAAPPAASSADTSDAAPKEASAAGETGSRCVTVGPFKALSRAAAAAGELRSSGLSPSQRVAQGDIWVGYWVYIKNIATQKRADAILANLRRHGITDAYVIPDTDSGNVVSLGVYSQIGRARRRREAVRALHYDVTVADRTRRGTVYWIDVRLAPGRSLDLDKLQPSGRIIRLEQRDCDSAHS